MIDYFINLFTKPEYQWTALDKLAMAGLILAVIIIIFALWFAVWFILELIKEHKYKTCNKPIKCIGYNYSKCLRCSDYKRVKKKGKKNE